jgi:hypothetical protein
MKAVTHPMHLGVQLPSRAPRAVGDAPAEVA